jgi:hypothetical protein
MTLTSAATGGSPNRGQPFTGSGVTAGTFIIALLTGSAGASGSTYSINQSQTVSSPTAMSNTGGNYVGAANQSQAISNFINRVADSAGLFPNDQTMFHYSNLRYPAIATGIGLTKVLMSYEGSQDWVTGIGAANTAGFNNTYQQALFQLAALDSSQFGTALTGFFNTICAIPNIFAPAVFLFITGSFGPNETNQRWAFCLPDSYANVSGTPTEGQALLNNGAWVAMSARNVALPN